MLVCTSVRGPYWIALAVFGMAACGAGNGNQAKPDARLAAFRDADIYDVPIVQPLPECPASCDDQNACTQDSCDPDTHLCRNDPAADGTACAAADLCSLEAACNTGLCVGTKSKDCTLPPDECHEEGYCVPTTGLCTYPNSTDHKACDDHNLCTTGDQCVAGVCQAAPIQCGAGLTCDPKTGQCPGFPTAAWGIVLDPSASTTGAIDPSFSDLTVSPTGALYFTAGFANTLDLGAGPMSTTSNPSTSADSFDYNAVVARLDPITGRALWSKSLGDRAKQVGSSIAANASDIVLVAGVYSGKIDLGSVQGGDAGSLVVSNTTSYPKSFLVALDGTLGKVLWALSTDVSGDGTQPSLRTRVVVDPYDNNFVLCASPTALASGLGMTHVGGKGDALIAKLEAQSGKILWGGQFGGAADESCDAVAADGKGKVYVSGHLVKGGSLDFGSAVIVLSGPTGVLQQAVYVAQLDGATGSPLWANVFGPQGTTTGKIKPTSLVADGKDVWVGGSFTYSAVFDPTKPLISSSSSGGMDAGTSPAQTSSAFVAALDASSGSHVWSRNWGSTAEVSSLALNTSGTLFLGGSYLTGMVFDTGVLANAPGSVVVPFVAKLTGTTGLTQTARGYASSSASSSAIQGIAVNKAEGLLQNVPYAIGVLGDVSAGIDLGAPVGTLPAQGATADGGAFYSAPTLFLVKFNP
jgi:hypothetical protein